MRTAPKQRPQPGRTTRDTAKRDAEELFRNYSVGPESRKMIRTVTHRTTLADRNASRYMASLPASAMLDGHWQLSVRNTYVTAFLERLVALCEEADNGTVDTFTPG